MAFLAFGAADGFDGDGIDVMVLQVFYEFGIGVVEFVAMAVGGSVAGVAGVAGWEVDFSGAVAIDAPAHAEVGELAYFVHFLDGSVAGLALQLPHPYVLRVVEIGEIGEVMDLYPFNGTAGMGVFVAIRVIACIAI